MLVTILLTSILLLPKVNPLYVTHPLIHAPNSLLPISPMQLYISVDHQFTVCMLKWIMKLSLLENLFQAPFAWIAYVEILPNGRVEYRKTENFINFPNGEDKSYSDTPWVMMTYNLLMTQAWSSPKTEKNSLSRHPWHVPSVVSMRTKQNSATVHNMGSRMKREDHRVNLRLRFRVKEGSSDRDNVLSKQGCSNREK
jgi:hypothetical protein